MKTCSWCKIEKTEAEYNKKASGRDGLSAHCRECQRKRHSERYAPAKPHLKYYIAHHSELKEKRDRNRGFLNECSRIYNKKNRSKKLESVMKSRNKNLEKYKNYCKEYQKNRYKNDELYRLKHCLRSLIISAFKRMSNGGKLKANKEYGVDFNAIFDRIGPRPGTGHEYHLDHIIPLAAFDLDNSEHVRLSHLPCNLRWISKKENLVKRSSIPEIAYIDPELRHILIKIGKM
jgi:hypothetical protein